MKKGWIALLAVAASIVMTSAAFAGQWKQDSKGWWYQRDDGTYPESQWEEIGDCSYYFDGAGYMVHDLWVDCIYYVNSDGAWEPERKDYDYEAIIKYNFPNR